MKTTQSILMKFTQLNKWAIWTSYIKFQVILKFFVNLGNLIFKGHRCLLWSCKYANKLKL